MKGLGIFKSEIVFLLWAGLMTDAAMAEEAVSSAKSEAASNAMQSLLSWLGSTLVIIAIIIVLGYVLKKMRVVVRKSAHMHILEHSHTSQCHHVLRLLQPTNLLVTSASPCQRHIPFQHFLKLQYRVSSKCAGPWDAELHIAIPIPREHRK